jgi:hypothetical protein
MRSFQIDHIALLDHSSDHYRATQKVSVYLPRIKMKEVQRKQKLCLSWEVSDENEYLSIAFNDYICM